MKVSSEAAFLDLLGLKAEKPTLKFLKKVVGSHLRAVPWENLSKLLRKNDGLQTLATFAEYVEGIREYQFGGTCHAQNSHLSSLLCHLGYEAELVSAVPEGLPSHVSIRIKIKDKNYFVDVGLMSSFCGVFPLDPDEISEAEIGDQRFVLKALPDKKNWSLQIYRHDQVVRAYRSDPNPLDHNAHLKAIGESFDDSAYFMKVLAVHRNMGDGDIGIWNSQLYFNKGTHREVRSLSSIDELQSALLKHLKLSRYPVKKAVDILMSNNCDIFSDRN